MNVKKDYNGPLPERLYPNWMTFYRALKASDYIKQGKETVLEEQWANGLFVHIYTADYLMARCFEEMAAYPFTMDDLMTIECALVTYPNGYDSDIINRVRGLITLQHMCRYPDRGF